jgi:hypothetical protein
MATWYFNIDYQYYSDNPASVGNVGSQAHPFSYRNLYNLVKGVAVNGINIADNDILRLKNSLVVQGAGSTTRLVFDNMVYDGLLITSWEDGAPWKWYQDPADLNVCELDVHNVFLKQYITVENAIISVRFDVQPSSMLADHRITFRNCIFGNYLNAPRINSINSYLRFEGCTFSTNVIASGSGGLNRLLGFYYCYFEDCNVVPDAQWGVDTNYLIIERCVFTRPSAVVLAAIPAGTVLTSSGNIYAVTPAAALPDPLALSQSNLNYLQYGIPVTDSAADNAWWAANEILYAYYVSDRFGYGAFYFDLDAAFDAVPQRGPSALTVQFTPRI